jgi:DNA-binding SARP family transcriptional activator
MDHGAQVTSAIPKKMKITLAVLLVRSNQVVSTEQLIAELWQDSPPLRATAAIYVYISQLRKLLGRENHKEAIITESAGYVLCAESDELDYISFQLLLRQGRSHLMQQECEQAVAVLEEALGLWRGPALRDLGDGPILGGFAARMGEARLECLELFIEAGFRLGRDREIVSMLFQLISEFPLHEVFYVQLMQALHHSERRADALRVYRRAWQVFASELGLEPSARLKELQRAVLEGKGYRRRDATAACP